MLFSLFMASFIASTLLPGGSEALLVYALTQGYSASTLCLIAGSGNVLGSVLTYLIGSVSGLYIYRRFLSVKEPLMQCAQGYFDRYGAFTLLFAWLPIVGDPICLLAGILRYPFFLFVLQIAIGKFSRYALLCWGVASFA